MIGQLLKVGTVVGGQLVMAKLSPMNRTFSNTPTKIQRTSVLSKGRTVSDFLATTHALALDFKQLGYNRWMLPELQENLSAPLDGSTVNLVDWTLGSLTVPTDQSYFVPGRSPDDQALVVIGQTTNLLSNSGFEYNTSYQTVFQDDFNRVGFDVGAVGSFQFFPTSYSPFAAPQYTGGTSALRLLRAVWVVPANIRTIPISHGTIEFWFSPYNWDSTDGMNRNLFSTNGISSGSYVADRLEISVQTGQITAALAADGPPFLTSVGSVQATFNVSDWVHVMVEYTSYGIVGVGAAGLVGGCTPYSQFNGSYRPITSLGTYFGLGGNLTGLAGLYSYNVYTLPFTGGSAPTVPVGTGVNPATAGLANATFSNLRINYGQVVDLSTTGASYLVPANELDTVDVRSYPAIFKNNTSWNQTLHSPGMGWLENPLSAIGIRPADQVYVNGRSELVLTSPSVPYLVTGGSPFWQDAAFSARMGSQSGSGPVRSGLAVHASPAGRVTLAVSYLSASFYSTYLEDGPDPIHYWHPNHLRDGGMDNPGVNAWNLGSILNLNTSGLAVTKEVTYVHSGSQALHVKRTSGANTAVAQQTVAGSASFYISGWYYGIAGNITANVQIAQTALVTSFIITPAYGQWTSFGGVVAVIAPNAHLTLTLDCPGVGEAWFDEVQIRKTSVTTPPQGNYYPDGLNDNPSFVTTPPWLKSSGSTAVSYLTKGTGAGQYKVNLNNPTSFIQSFYQSIYYPIPGRMGLTIVPILNLTTNPVSGSIVALPSGNTGTFTSTAPDGNGNLTTAAFTYLPSDSYLQLTMIVPASHSFAVNQMQLSYTTDLGASFDAYVVTSGQSYFGTLSNGVASYSWNWVSTDQHEGNIGLEVVGQFSCDYLTVGQQLSSWVVTLPSVSFEGISTTATPVGAAVAITPDSPYHGKNALAITNLAGGINAYVTQPLASTPFFTLMSLAYKFNSPDSFEQSLSSTVALVGGVPLNAAPDWSLVMLPPLYTVAPIDHLILTNTAIGTAWFDRLQLEAAGFVTSYYDTFALPATRPPVTLSYDAEYINPTAGTMMAWVNLAPGDSPYAQNGALFSIGKRQADYVLVGWSNQNTTMEVRNPSGPILSVPFPRPVGWNHLAVTWSPAGTWLFQNGVMIGQTSTIWQMPSSGVIAVGFDPYDVTSYQTWSNAWFEKFYILDRNISQNELQRVVRNSEYEGLSVLEIDGLANLETGTYQFTFNDLRGHTTSYDVLLNEFGITNISGQLRHADVALKMTQK